MPQSAWLRQTTAHAGSMARKVREDVNLLADLAVPLPRPEESREATECLPAADARHVD